MQNLTDQEIEHRKISAVLMLQMALAAADLAVCEFVEAVKPRNSHKLEVNALYNKILSVRKMVATARTLDKDENKKLRSNLFSTGGAMFEFMRYLSLINDVDIDKFVGELVELAEKYISQ